MQIDGGIGTIACQVLSQGRNARTRIVIDTAVPRQSTSDARHYMHICAGVPDSPSSLHARNMHA